MSLNLWGVGQSLRAGKPVLVVPFAHDQFDNAARITRLGVGRILPRAKYNTMRAIKELSRLLKEQSYTIRATAIACHVQIEDGICTACDAIGEQLLHHP